MNDALEILRTIAEYCHAIDERSGAGLGDLFTEHGELDFMGQRFKGRQAIVERLAHAGGGLVHVPYNPVLDITGDTAKGTVDHLLLRRVENAPTEVFVVGRWVDEYLRDGDRWRIASRCITMPFGPPPRPP